MEFQQLEMFTAVVEEGSVRRASERVFRTASAVSIALKKLEQEIGAPLFSRTEQNQQSLTPSGQLVYSYATRILHLKREAISRLEDFTQCRTGSVRIGANESTSLYLLPKLVHAFQAKHPGLKLETICDNSERVISALKDWQIDLALVAYTGDEPSLKKHLIMHDEIVLIANPNHRLTKLSEVTVKELANEVLIAETTASSLHEEVERAFTQAGVQLNVHVANASIEGIKRMVAEGVGVGFVPLMCVTEEETRGELVTIRVRGVSRQRELWLVHRMARALSPAAQSFIKISLQLARLWANGPTTSERATQPAKPDRFPRRLQSRSYC
jgi:DNA-binding transcriptional LysR family regulator